MARLQAAADEIASKADAAALLIWRSQQALLVTRLDAHLPYFHEACTDMAAAGWPVVVRKSGGGACPVGPGTVELAIIEPALAGAAIDAKYEALSALMRAALQSFGIASRSAPVTGAYCSGNYDLAVAGRKIAGLSQHWFRNRTDVRCVITAASLNVAEAPNALADAVNRFYARAGSPVRCQAAALTGLRRCAIPAGASDLAATLTGRLAALAGSSAQVRTPPLTPH